MDHPRLGVISDNRLSWFMRSVLQPGLGANLESFVNLLQNTLASYLQDAGDLANGLAARIVPQHLGALHIAERSRLGVAQLIQVLSLLIVEDKP